MFFLKLGQKWLNLKLLIVYFFLAKYINTKLVKGYCYVSFALKKDLINTEYFLS